MTAGTITALEIQKRNKERVSVFLDNEYAFSLSLVEAAKLHKGQSLSAAEVEALQSDDAIIQAVDSAAHFLGYRPRSLMEVRRNLAEKDFPPAVIEAAVEQLVTRGYVDDAAFARYWVQNRNEFKPLSPRALHQELRQKGVADDVIREVLAEMDADDLAYKAAATQIRRLRGQTRRDFKTRLGNFLQRRGFSYSTTHEAITRLLDELEASDADYFQSREMHEE